MKRAFLQKVRSVSCPTNTVPSQAGQPEQTSLGTKRKTRTSAAMLGLALSMGTSGLLIPRQSEQANAAEPKLPEPTFSASSSAEAESTSLNHTVRQGETLWIVSRKYRVGVNEIATANNLTLASSLKVGQVLRIPTESPNPTATTTATRPIPVKTESTPENLLASADIERLSIAHQPSTPSAATPERNQALTRLRQERERLMNRMAELRQQRAVPVQVATQPADQSLDTKPQATQAPRLIPRQTQPATMPYQVRPGDTLAAIARSHEVSPQSLASANQLQNPNQLRVNQSLSIPAPAIAQAVPPTTSVLAPSVPAPMANLPTNAPTRNLPIPAPASLRQAVPNTTQPTRVAVANFTQSSSYRVSLGDTVASIARAHNIAPSMLVSANRLIDANVIFVGQVLKIPAAPAIGGDLTQSTPVTVRQPTSQPQAIAAAPLTTLPTPAVPHVPVQPSLQTAGHPVVVSSNNAQFNPYVQNLLTEVRALQVRHRQVNPTAESAPSVPTRVVSGSINPPTPLADSVRIQVPEADSASSTTRRSVTVNPVTPTAQPLGNVTRTNQSSNPNSNSASSQNLVATAPLGSEAYAPLLQPVTGRVVSPELPSLQNPDTFLPEGKPKFNGYIWPARGVLTSGYGWRWGRMHRGIDIAADVGTPIYAAADGVVEYADWNSGGFGNLVEVRHADGSMTRYAHLNRILVRVGDRVKQGQQVAEMGSTGYSTGPHLHFEVHLADGTANPMAYLPPQ